MKRIAVLSAVIFFSAAASAQQAPPAEPKKDAPATQSSVAASEETRMKTLEDQVRTLAEQVTLLRGELKAMRDARSVEPRSEEPILLAASHVAPGILAPAGDRKSTRLNSSHGYISYAVFCLKKKNEKTITN